MYSSVSLLFLFILKVPLVGEAVVGGVMELRVTANLGPARGPRGQQAAGSPWNFTSVGQQALSHRAPARLGAASNPVAPGLCRAGGRGMKVQTDLSVCGQRTAAPRGQRLGAWRGSSAPRSSGWPCGGNASKGLSWVRGCCDGMSFLSQARAVGTGSSTVYRYRGGCTEGISNSPRSCTCQGERRPCLQAA